MKLQNLIKQIIKEEVSTSVTDDDLKKRINTFYNAMKKVGLNPDKKSITRDENYPNSLMCTYQSRSVFSIKTFSDIEKLTGARLTFKPESHGILLWYNFDQNF